MNRCPAVGIQVVYNTASIKWPIFSDICSVGSPRSCLYIGASCIFCYDTTSFVCLLGEVRVAAKGVEALEFLFREVRVMWVAWGGWKVAFWG